MINLETTMEESDLILAIVKRAQRDGLLNGVTDFINSIMDITSTHCNGCAMNLQKLLDFSTINFAHDLYGIHNNLNRKTGQLENCFLPRSAL
jgi:hypothetical protein